MTTGKVKWFNNAKGYGFVLAESADEDLFVHYSSIQMTGYRTLRAGQEVTFDIQQGPKGLHAVNVRPLDAPDELGPPDDAAEEFGPSMDAADELEPPIEDADSADGSGL